MKPRLLKSILNIYFTCGFIATSGAVFYPSIQWTPDNPLIQNLNGTVRKVRTDDGLNIWCPKDYSQQVTTKGQVDRQNLYFTLYEVKTKDEYDECDASNGKRLLVCNDPAGDTTSDKEYYLLLFRKNPIFLEYDVYPPGKTYYFIGTSDGKQKTLENKVGGKCLTHNLKLAIYVCSKDEACNVDVVDGGWSLWQRNEKTDQCERSCTNPEPQNGGKPCEGPSSLSCSQVIRNSKTEKTTPSSATPGTQESQNQIRTPTTNSLDKTATAPSTHEIGIKHSSGLTTPSQSVKEAIDDNRKDDSNNVTLSMDRAILTFIGLFILGCVVGILQVLAILHVRSKKCGKHPELQAPVNHV